MDERPPNAFADRCWIETASRADSDLDLSVRAQRNKEVKDSSRERVASITAKELRDHSISAALQVQCLRGMLHFLLGQTPFSWRQGYYGSKFCNGEETPDLFGQALRDIGHITCQPPSNSLRTYRNLRKRRGDNSCRDEPPAHNLKSDTVSTRAQQYRFLVARSIGICWHAWQSAPHIISPVGSIGGTRIMIPRLREKGSTPPTLYLKTNFF